MGSVSIPICIPSNASGTSVASSSKHHCLQTARDRHRRSVSHLRGMAELVKDLQEEVRGLRSENAGLSTKLETAHNTIEDLQVKHDAAQSHLDATITQQVTPRTRSNLDARQRLLQPTLGARLAASFVGDRHLKHKKDAVRSARLETHSSRSAHSPES